MKTSECYLICFVLVYGKERGEGEGLCPKFYMGVKGEKNGKFMPPNFTGSKRGEEWKV